jgi:hypothetical protein
MDNNRTFGAIYVTAIAVTLIASLYANHLSHIWNHMVFTFPPDTQQVVINGTAVMEVSWRWLPETLEMTVKVNDDDTKSREDINDELWLLFDSDNSGNLSTSFGYPDGPVDDHAVFISTGNYSRVCMHSAIRYPYGHIGYPSYQSGPPLPGVLIAENLNNTYAIYREGEGYEIKISIPRELINVSPPTPIGIAYADGDALWQQQDWPFVTATFTGVK